MGGKRQRTSENEAEEFETGDPGLATKKQRADPGQKDQARAENDHDEPQTPGPQTRSQKQRTMSNTEGIVELNGSTIRELQKRAKEAEQRAARLERENKDLLSEKDDLRKQIADLHSRLLENGRAQGRSYLLDDSDIKKKFKFLVKKIDNWAASVAIKGSLDESLTVSKLTPLLQLVEGKTDVFPYPVVQKPKWQNFRGLYQGPQFLVQAIVHHCIAYNIIGKAFHFLEKSESLPADSFKSPLEYMDGDETDKDIWYSRTLRAFYRPEQYEGKLMEPLKDDSFPKSRKIFYRACVNELLHQKQGLLKDLLQHVDAEGLRTRFEELHGIFAAAGKLSLQLWVQDMQVTVHGLKCDDGKKGFELGTANVELHYLCKKVDTSKGLTRNTLALLTRPQIKCERYDPGGRRSMKMIALKAEVVLPMADDSQRDRSKSCTPDEVPPPPPLIVLPGINETESAPRAKQPITQHVQETKTSTAKLIAGDEATSDIQGVRSVREKEHQVDHVAATNTAHSNESHNSLSASSQVSSQPCDSDGTAGYHSQPPALEQQRISACNDNRGAADEDRHDGLPSYAEKQESREGRDQEMVAEPSELVPPMSTAVTKLDDIQEITCKEFEEAVAAANEIKLRRVAGKLHACIKDTESGEAVNSENTSKEFD